MLAKMLGDFLIKVKGETKLVELEIDCELNVLMRKGKYNLIFLVFELVCDDRFFIRFD